MTSLGTQLPPYPALSLHPTEWELPRPCELILPSPPLYDPFPVEYSPVQTGIFLLQAVSGTTETRKTMLAAVSASYRTVLASSAPDPPLEVSFPDYLCICSSLSAVWVTAVPSQDNLN